MCSVLFVEGNVDNFVDERGNHEDIYNFARKADIVVCCLRLNSETVEPIPVLHLSVFSQLFVHSVTFACLIPHCFVFFSLTISI